MTNTIFHSQYGVKREKSVYWTRCNALQLRALLYLPVSVSTLLILPLCQMPRTLHCPSTALCHCPPCEGTSSTTIQVNFLYSRNKGIHQMPLSQKTDVGTDIQLFYQSDDKRFLFRCQYSCWEHFHASVKV